MTIHQVSEAELAQVWPGDRVTMTAKVFADGGGLRFRYSLILHAPLAPSTDYAMDIEWTTPDVRPPTPESDRYHWHELVPAGPDTPVDLSGQVTIGSWGDGPYTIQVYAQELIESPYAGTLSVTHAGVRVTSRRPLPGLGGSGDPVSTRGAGDRVLRRDSEPDGARLSALQGLAADTGSLVYHTRDGQLIYETPDYRAGLAGATPALALMDADIIDAVSWTSRLDDVVTDVTVVYGDAEREEERPRVRVTAPTVGDLPRATEVDSPLLNAADAQALADRIIARWSTPSWTAPQIITRDDLLDDTTYEQLLQLDVSSVVDTSGVTGQPDLTGGTGRWVVEGWEETWDAPQGVLHHEVQLAVSELSRWT